MILNNYLLKSEIAVLKLSDKNYDSLMTDLSNNNNFVIILNNLLSYLPYQKRIELYSKLKFQALIIAKKKNLTENEFLLELLDQIKSMDSTTYRKVKEQINKSIKEINPNILSKRPFLKKDNKAHSVFLESSEDIIQNQMSSYNSMPSLKYVNTLSDKDFDYFLNLKKEIYIRKKLKFSNFEAYNNVEDIIESDENLLEFLNLYISDYEVLFEFAQNSFRNPVKNRLKDLIDNKNNILIQVENYFLKLQKETFFSTLNTSEFKIFIRVKILKTLVFTVYYKNQFNVSAFTMDLIETLSKNRNINYKQTAAIGLKSLANTILEKEIIKGIIYYFDSNNFEPINKKIKDDEFLKNTIYFFLINKNIPSWSSMRVIWLSSSRGNFSYLFKSK